MTSISKSQKTINKNLKLLERVKLNYIPMRSRGSSDSFDYVPPPSKDKSLNHEPQTIKYHIDPETGKMEIEGNRFIRLGKVQLYDSLEDKLLSQRKFIVILDTTSQILHCFDVKKLYNEFVVAEKNHAFTKHGSFNLSESTKSMVLGEMFGK